MKSRDQISYNMSRIRSSGTKIEIVFGKLLWANGLRYRKQYKKVLGKPDFVLVSAKIAMFCDSAFWHGKNWRNAQKELKTNRDFWIRKIESNIRRDTRVTYELNRGGWLVLRFWEDDILKAPQKCVARVLEALEKRNAQKFSTKSRGNRLFLRRGGHDARIDSGRHSCVGRRG
jgi:DNA mismatch endonuclease, patch repair protein